MCQRAAGGKCSKIMTLRKMSRREVLNSYSTNRFDIFNDYDGNFPDLDQNRPAPVKNRKAEVNRKPTPPRPKPNFIANYTCYIKGK